MTIDTNETSIALDREDESAEYCLEHDYWYEHKRDISLNVEEL
jgi:hypothetical protein